ncbi:MAG TPA: hypothetical protein VMT88_06170 [Actinomycetes bacterium]|nr:hypothetical protein [Actinomycetes bacterium]
MDIDKAPKLLELAWHDCYGVVTPPDDVIADVLVRSGRRGFHRPGRAARCRGLAGPPLTRFAEGRLDSPASALRVRYPKDPGCQRTTQ